MKKKEYVELKGEDCATRKNSIIGIKLTCDFCGAEMEFGSRMITVCSDCLKALKELILEKRGL